MLSFLSVHEWSPYAVGIVFLARTVLSKGDFGTRTFPELLRVNPWMIIVPLSAALIGLLFWLEQAGL